MIMRPPPHSPRGTDSTAQPLKYTLSPTPSISSKKESRKSLLNAVSSLKFPGRRHKPARSATAPNNPFHSTPLLIPGVLEIKPDTRPRDDECEERERLREAAARAIGLVEEEEVETFTDSDDDERETEEQNTSMTHTREGLESLYRSSLYDVQSRRQSSPQPHPFRTASPSRPSTYLGSHNRTASSLASTPSAPVVPIPPFPATLAQLTPFIQKSATLPKYYPPPSLRIFALSKLWKLRHLILTSPPIPTSSGLSPQSPQPSYLHLFRTSGSQELEIERLQVNEDSVVFIAEEGLVGGRKGVIKVGGADGAKIEPSDAQDGPTLTTMWFLQITETAEAQKWIEAIKSKVLLQRSMRAGLGATQSNVGNGIEPRGDMDVMLSLRAQGMYTIPPVSKPSSAADTVSLSSRRSSKAPTTSSRPATSASATPSHVPTSSTSLSTLKGLFHPNRPRSPSTASSLNTAPLSSGSESDGHGTIDGSFAGAGTNLLQLDMRQRADSFGDTNNGSRASMIVSSQPQPRRPHSTISTAQIMERKILQHPFLLAMDDEPPPSPTVQITPPPSKTSLDRANRALSLQPPPRKRWTTVDTSTEGEAPQTGIYNSGLGRIVTGSMSAFGSTSPIEQDTGTQSSLSPIERTRTGSLQSNSTAASHSGSGEASNHTGAPRRWSRRGMSLPRRSSPPSGPPPATPISNATLSVQSIQLHSHSSDIADRRRSSSQISNTSTSRSSQHSLVSGLPNFNKRSSVASTFSAATSASQSSSAANSSPNSPRPLSSHRTSAPPPPRGPPPTAALPAAPGSSEQDVPTPLVSSKLSFRDSVAIRAMRLSLTGSSGLPSKNDEPEHGPSRVQRRVSGSSRSLVEQGRRSGEALGTIPASPIPPPASPPTIPLPATPVSPAQTSSIKHRLRILSAPSPASASREEAIPAESMPHSPLGEHIAPPWMQNDPSFIEDLPPLTPTRPRALPMPPIRQLPQQPEFQSLSPPPRRRSVQPYEKLDNDEPAKLSRSGSVVSLGNHDDA